MAMSLEDLLAEEGFKRRKAKMKARDSFAAERTSVPLYMEQDRHESGSLLAVRRTGRTRSDIPRFDSKAEFSTSSSCAGMKPRNNLMRRGKIEQEPDKGTVVNSERRRAKRFSIGSSEDLQSSEITEVVENDGIAEVGTNRSYKDAHSNNIHSCNRNGQKDSASFEERERYRNKDKSNSFVHAYPHVVHISSSDTNLRSIKQHQSSEGRSNKGLESGKFGKSRITRPNELDEAQAVPAVDDAAINAIISIFSGHVTRFLDDEDFRISLRHNSYASLNLLGVDESLSAESKVIENLEQAIETVERGAEKSATLKELKRASLQLSVITGLNSKDLHDRFTSGVPNLRLSACAHLYLSVIYNLQNKRKAAAKCLLQVFCDSPFQARTALLPDLWDRAFLPHLLHLKVWYDKETYPEADSPIFTNLRLLDEAYKESLDTGTYQLAVYYKDWIMNGEGAPSVPFIRIPSLSVQRTLRRGLRGHTSSPASHVSPQSIVSKELYDEVFKHSDKPGVEPQLYEEENFDSYAARSPNSSAPDDKQLILPTCDSATQTYEVVESVGTNNIYMVEETWITHSELGEENHHEEYGSSHRSQGKLHTSYETRALPPEKENILIVESPQTVLEFKQAHDFVVHAEPRFLSRLENVSDHVVLESEKKIMQKTELEPALLGW